MNNLIKKAKEKNITKSKRVFTKDEVYLAMAFVKGQVPLAGVAHAIGIKNRNSSSASYYFIARALKQHFSSLKK